MPGCRQCGKEWPEGYQICPDDGEPLLALATGPTIASSPGGLAPALATKSSEELPPGSPAGEYVIERKIGQGGMGSVYGARHPVIGKRAAIKVISRELSASDEAVERFIREAQAVNQIGHPNIVDVFGFGQLPDGRSFFVMEWLQGESLRQRLQKPIGYADALEILESIAKALEAAHDAGVMHRDLKPDNVFLEQVKGEKPKVKLLDFGLAKLSGSGEGAGFDRTRTGVVMGTPLYLSPEQAKGVKVDFATDVYSLGAMAYEMFSGVVPFRADSAVEIMAMHISTAPVPLSQVARHVPPETAHLVASMLQKEPRARPSATAVREQLAGLRAAAQAAIHGGGPGLATSSLMRPASGPAMTPQPPPGGPRGGPYGPQVTPASTPYQTPSPYAAPHAGTPHPSSAPVAAVSAPGALSMPQAGGAITSPPVAAGSAGRRAAIVALLALVGAGLGVGLLFAAGGSGDDAGARRDSVAAGAPATPAPESPPAPSAEPAGAPAAPAPESPPAAPAPESPPAPSSVAPVEAPAPSTPAVDKPAGRPEPARARTGKIVLTFSGPRRANVHVDRKSLGEKTGKVVLELTPGEHTISVSARGFRMATHKVRVEPGAARDVNLALEKIKNVNAAADPFAED